MRAPTVLLLVLGLTACGRIGFGSAGGGSDGGEGGGDGGATINPGDPCVSVPRLPAAPVIDGALEPRLALHPIPWPPPWYPIDASPLPDTRTRYALAWTPAGLYVFVEVDDPDAWPAILMDRPFCGDAFELYVDSDGSYPNAPGYDPDGTRQFIARAAIDTATPRTLGTIYRDGSEVGAWSSGFVAVAHPQARRLEAFLDASSLGLAAWTPAVDQRIGFDLSVNLSAADGNGPPWIECTGNRRLGQYFRNIATTGCEFPFCNVETFCTPRLD